MLVLTRRTGESIVIGNDIVVTVLEVRHDQVRIGIDAPRSVQVHREEVFNEVMRENTAAVASAADRANPLLRKPAATPQPPRRGPRLEPRREPPPPRPAATPMAPPATHSDGKAATDGQTGTAPTSEQPPAAPEQDGESGSD